jgi:hypothetical protein
MVQSIVFFNLADKHDAGLAQKSVNSLRNKYKQYSRISEFFYGANRVHQVDLFNFLSEAKDRSADRSLSALAIDRPSAEERRRIVELCSTSSKIMLGVHGKYDDTVHGYAGMGWERGEGVVGTYEEFARLICEFLSPGKTYHLALIVCFGARSSNFLTNHDGKLSKHDIQSSFAYRFFKVLCQNTHATVKMTARTGEVSFDPATGRSMVQTEAAVVAQVSNDDLQENLETLRVKEEYDRIMGRADKQGMKDLRQLEFHMADKTSVPRNHEEDIFKKFAEIKAAANRLATERDEEKPKYGKFVYSYADGVVKVCRKYESGRKVMSILYEGPI